MEAAPIICPACGELIIVRSTPDGRAMVIPVHPDRVTPTATCVADAPIAVSRKLPLR